ncbi:recombinase family protein [Burkholderia ubonensis]|uniref:recombinase family protein n=1 Tax=Burkholderia ubonensis TaxID=101571 RepID=UPI0009B2F1DD|nr:recombinase family protein [Burkholderia ubonensis]
MSQPLVISYVRFSTARQATGDSLRRQTAAAREWCLKRGWTLDEKLSCRDLGLSGFNQDNASRGALSVFLDKVRSGDIPGGSYLIVENLDRLTRAELPVAVSLLLSIVSADIICVTLQDGQEWTKERLANPADFMLSVMLLYRGHDESKVKSIRIRAVHDKAREERDRSVFGRAPGWLRRTSDGKAWEPVPELVEVVKKVFDLSASGYGGVAIARRANEEKWPVPSLSAKESGTTWHVTFPAKLVRNRAVLGELEFHVSRDGQPTPTGQVVKDWYPQIVDEDLFFRANAAINSRRSKPNRRDATYRNIFQGIIFCGHCGATMARKAKAGGKKNSPGYAQFVCSDRHRGASGCPSINAKELEVGLIPSIFQMLREHLGNEANLDPIRKELAAVHGELEEFQKRRGRLADAIEQADVPIPVLVQRLTECEQAIPGLEARESVLKAQLQEFTFSPDDDTASDAILRALYSDDEASERLRAETHLKMLLTIDAIWVWPQELAVIQWKSTNLLAPLALYKPEKRRTGRAARNPIEIPKSFNVSNRYLEAIQGKIDFPEKRQPQLSENATIHTQKRRRNPINPPSAD